MKLYNTLTREVDELTPLTDNTVKLYTCGLTVYSQPHIGNWLGYIYWDVLVRTLRGAGFTVKRTQNITDVGHLTSDDDNGEDKMEKGARSEGVTAWDVAAKYIDIAAKESALLGLLPAEHLVRATDMIDQQIAFAAQLDTKGFLYEIPGDGMYFDTAKLPEYGRLARLDIDGLEAGARVSVEGKRNITDFAVWKFSPAGTKRDMEWWTEWGASDSSEETHVVGETRAPHSSRMQGSDEQRTEPYQQYGEGVAQSVTQQAAESRSGAAGFAGRQGAAVRGSWGFPGWHLECSVIARETLGDQIDIHTGGIDHIPVHHINEIAQTEAVTGKPFSQFWVHNNHLKADGQKMSKSLGNIYTLQDMLDKGYTMAAFRVFALGKHYRTEGNFTWDNLEAAQNRLNNWREFAALVWQAKRTGNNFTTSFVHTEERIARSLQDDLNTPLAIADIDALTKNMLDNLVSVSDEAAAKHFVEYIQTSLGIDISAPDITDDQKQLIAAREQARETKDWAKSDELRDTLLEQGIGLRDTPSGAIWYHQA